MTRTAMIIRDILYLTMVVLLLLPNSPVELALNVRLPIAILIFGTRVWQHVSYYKATGKIY